MLDMVGLAVKERYIVCRKKKIPWPDEGKKKNLRVL
jgi:hypothetical protein